MTSASTPGPLNPGNIVSAALRMYRDRFKMYFGLSLVAVLWIFAPIVGIAIVAGILAALTPPPAVWLILVPIAIGLFIYCGAKYAMYTGVMSRLSFRELINAPETPKEARRALQPKMWSFLWLGFLLLCIFVAAYFVIGIGVAIVGGIVGGLLGFLLSTAFGDSGIIVGTFVTFIIIIVGVLFGLLLVLSRVFMAEVPLSTEAKIGASDSIGRSWQLTKNSVRRIQLVVLAAYLITLPTIILTFIPQMVQLFLTEPGSAAYNLLTVASLLVSLAVNIFVVPFWQVVKGVLYYDLRSRREGIDLSL